LFSHINLVSVISTLAGFVMENPFGLPQQFGVEAVVDGRFRTMVVCNLRQQQIHQFDCLTKRCRFWSPAWRAQV